MTDEETTVRIRRDSVGLASVEVFPCAQSSLSAVNLLQRQWENAYAVMQTDNEELRAQVRALLEENGKIRDVLNTVRGPR